MRTDAPNTRRLTRHDLTEAEQALQMRQALADAHNPDGWRQLSDDDVPGLYDEPEDRGHDMAGVEWDDPEECDWEPNPVPPVRPVRRPVEMTSYRSAIRAARKANTKPGRVA